jgi:hypothetical protein
MADDITHYDVVEGYCGALSALPGDSVALHVRCTSNTYDVSVSPWGGDEVWSAHGLPGVAHDTPADADANGCGWPMAVSIPVGDEWPSGMYLVTLSAPDAPADRARGYAMFVVRARPDRRNRVLLVLATNTYNAYNTWGGCSLYTGGHQVSFDRPFGRGMLVRPTVERDDRKARPTYTGEAPDADGTEYQRFRHANGFAAWVGSAGWFTYERRFVEWARREGIAIDLAVSTDLHDPTVVAGYRQVLGVGHDEYWSAAQRATVEAHVANGGDYASFSGNTMFWQVRLDATGRTMTCHKYAAHRADPVMGTAAEQTMSGMWCDPVVGNPEWRFLGGGSAYGLYSRFGQATPRGSGAFTVYRNDHWLFADTGLRYGDLLGRDHGIVGYETVGCRLGFDEYQLPIAVDGDGAPAAREVVAFTPASNLGMGDYPASISALNDQGDLEFIAERLFGVVNADSVARVRHGNAVMLTCKPFGPGSGEVVTIGSTDWVFGLDDPAVAQVTRNVLRRPG